FELALACDLRVAVDNALFGLPEVKVGIPSVMDAALLQEHVGLSMAKEIILTGDLYPVETLQRLGLINRIASPHSLQSATSNLLARITRHTRTVLASQKRLFELWLNTPLNAGIESSVEEFSRVFESPETLEQIQRHRSTLSNGQGQKS
ncbi:MAG TPA: enoyl-CoA hydratase-related protein, partial [Gammaproteobacteria bacterium]|nr:enoyl-CoA hydratase-related protein [Gammaproteobacteria bacterium]